MITSEDILNFWFEGVTDETPINKNALPFSKWFVQDEELDKEIKQKFEGVLLKAKEGQLKDWEVSAQGRLALVILFDQFFRNMYRDTPEMYATDALALDLSLRTIKDQMDQSLPLIYRVFLYTPLMHTENLTTQSLSVQSFEKLTQEVRIKYPDNAHYFEYNLKFARRHLSIIVQFGRFPHRNAILNRLSSPQEQDFLQKKHL